MANTTIQLKYSVVSSNAPSSLANGEIAINAADGKLFYSTPGGSIQSIVTYPGPAGLNKEVQFNDAGSAGANSSFTFDKSSGVLTSKSLSLTVANGTAPLSVTSNTVVANLNADLFDGFHSTYFAPATTAQAAFDKANTQFWTYTSASAGPCPTANYWIKALTFTLPNVGDSTTIRLRTKIKLFANTTYSDNDDTDSVLLTYAKTGASTVLGTAYWYPENSENAISNALANHTLTYNATTGLFEYYRRSTVIGGHLLVKIDEVIQANTTLQTVEPTIVTNNTWVSAVTSLGATATFDDIDEYFEDLTVSGTLTVSSTVTTAGANATVGSSTANSTYNLGSGATVASNAKFVNVGTGGVAGSTTQITIGSVNSSNTIVYGRTEFDLDGTGLPLTGATNPIASFVATSNNYIQTYILNSSNGKYASSDLVAFPVNGNDANGWIDVGITSNTFNYPIYSITGANEGYLFMSAPGGSGTSGNLVIATDSTGTYNSIEFYAGGFAQAKGTAEVVITTQTSSTSNTTGALLVKNGLGVTGNVYADGIYDGGNRIIDIANSKTYIFEQNTVPLTANVSDRWVNIDTGVEYHNFGNTTNPVWAEIGPTGVLANTQPGAINASSLSINGNISVNGPAFSAYPNSSISQTISSGSTQQKVLFQLEEYDTNNNFSSSRFTPTVAGYYQLNAAVRLDGGNGTGECMIVIWKNGAEYKRGWNSSGTQFASSFWSMGVSTTAYANGTTDYFEVYVQQGNASSVNVTVAGGNITYFNGCMLRGA